MKLKLFKIEEGLLKGNVVFHRLSNFFYKNNKELKFFIKKVKKDNNEIHEQKNKIKIKNKEKEQRKLQQQKRVNQKLEQEEENPTVSSYINFFLIHFTFS